MIGLCINQCWVHYGRLHKTWRKNRPDMKPSLRNMPVNAGYSRKWDRTVEYDMLFNNCEDPIMVNAKEMMAMLKDSLYLPTRWRAARSESGSLLWGDRTCIFVSFLIDFAVCQATKPSPFLTALAWIRLSFRYHRTLRLRIEPVRKTNRWKLPKSSGKIKCQAQRAQRINKAEDDQWSW